MPLVRDRRRVQKILHKIVSSKPTLGGRKKKERKIPLIRDRRRVPKILLKMVSSKPAFGGR